MLQEANKNIILSSCREAEARIFANTSERERSVLEYLLDCSDAFREAAAGSDFYPSTNVRHAAEQVRRMYADNEFDQTRLPIAWQSVQALFPAANRLLDFY